MNQSNELEFFTSTARFMTGQWICAVASAAATALNTAQLLRHDEVHGFAFKPPARFLR
jgi:hypothetical protein